MDKQALKVRMLALETDELAAAREHYLEHVRDARTTATTPTRSTRYA